MKRMILISLIAGLFSIIFPIVIGLLTPFDYVPEKAADATPEITVIHTSEDEEYGKDGEVSVSLLHDGQVLKLNMHTYLTGVLAAEMPASFNLEALKAQAVAARTYTVYKMLSGSSENHPEAQICSDSSCCQAFCDDADMKEKWGENYETNRDKIISAVLGTDGECVVYGDEPILAAFHSSSSGATQASGNVWGSALPYLISVESPESEEDVPNYEYTVTVSFSDFTETIASKYPDASFGEDKGTWIGETIRDNSGRVQSVVIGGVSISGTALRTLFSLRSTAIDFEMIDTGISITTTGYGHGVGLSQYGANVLAEKGFSCEDIIAWYYTGTELRNISKFFS